MGREADDFFPLLTVGVRLRRRLHLADALWFLVAVACGLAIFHRYQIHPLAPEAYIGFRMGSEPSINKVQAPEIIREAIDDLKGVGAFDPSEFLRGMVIEYRADEGVPGETLPLGRLAGTTLVIRRSTGDPPADHRIVNALHRTVIRHWYSPTNVYSLGSTEPSVTIAGETELWSPSLASKPWSRAATATFLAWLVIMIIRYVKIVPLPRRSFRGNASPPADDEP